MNLIQRAGRGDERGRWQLQQQSNTSAGQPARRSKYMASCPDGHTTILHMILLPHLSLLRPTFTVSLNCLNTADYCRLPQTTTDYCRLTVDYTDNVLQVSVGKNLLHTEVLVNFWSQYLPQTKVYVLQGRFKRAGVSGKFPAPCSQALSVYSTSFNKLVCGVYCLQSSLL